MRIAYLECASGISGDMTLAALVDAGADLAKIQADIDSLGLPGCRLVSREVQKNGFRALQIVVEHAPEKAHRHLHHITAMIDRGTLSPRARDTAKRIFQKLAEAEAKVHGTTVEKVHFHEVGAVDSIADIVGTAIAFDLLDVAQVACSPIPTGNGFVDIAHGKCAIPAPATGELLRGVPIAPTAVEGELPAPTRAAIARLTGHELLARPEDAALRRSIELKEPSLDPLNFIQIQLLRDYRGGRDRGAPAAELELFEQALVSSIEGVATGLGTTG